jgi:hypothetical protein
MTDGSDSGRSPPHPEVTPEQGFALVLEQACSAFETLQGFVTGSLSISSSDPIQAVRATGTMHLALAQSFLFLSVRAFRICKHGKSVLGLPREEWKRFESELAGVVDVRDVSEHGLDLNRYRGGEVTRPSMHAHDQHNSAADETSLIVLGPTTILMGPLNLWDIYQSVARMRAIAGFQALGVRQRQGGC